LTELKLTVQIKLQPTPEQADALRETLETANSAADRLSQLAWEAKEFRRFPLHKRFYRQIRNEFPLTAQVVCLLNAKVADAYKLDKKVQRVFRKHGSISYDARILSLNLIPSTVSIWTVKGRAKMPFVCGERQRTLLAYPRGESDLILRNRKWFLNITVEVPEEKEIEAVDVLGVDMGIVNICADSDGNKYSGAKLNKVRHRNRALRRKLQRIGTKSAKRLLKKRSRKEQRFAKDTNHTISRRIVSLAKRTNRMIAIEELTGIRSRVRAGKRERTKLHSWSFAELGGMLDYKAKFAGVPLLRIDPRNTSRQCSKCGHTEKANRKSRDSFVCKSCGHTACADENGAANIRLKGLTLAGAGAFNHPNVATIFCGNIHN
jgi:IS605 OrfB family transposase